MPTRAPRHQRLPAAGEEREALRKRGQFWTPDWLAEAMVGYCIAGGADTVFDPAVGAGAFFRAAKVIARQSGRTLALAGCELHREVLSDALAAGLTTEDIAAVQERDFVLQPPDVEVGCMVANPPYLRHHRLSPEAKSHLQRFAHSLLGKSLDGRAGFHVYFLLRALTLLRPHGRLAFVMPADTCEGVFAQTLWSWITRHFRLDAVITFPPEATPFPGVDTNAIVVLIRREAPVDTFRWVSCASRGDDLRNWLLVDMGDEPGQSLSVKRANIKHGVAQGLSRSPVAGNEADATLSDFATVVRGIATGANDFFHLTRSDADRLGIPQRWLVPAIGRTRDVERDVITRAMLDELDNRGRATRLLALDATPESRLPEPLRCYLRHGETLGLPLRPLIATRRPWYRMEVRRVPPFLFAYLGRRSARFIRNEAGVVPLTGFLCVYPRDSRPAAIEKLWNVLSHPDTIARLSRVGKSYGGGAIKVEPRGLERLPIPPHVLDLAGMELPGGQLACL